MQNNSKKDIFIVSAESAGLRIDNFLSEKIPGKSRSHLQKLIGSSFVKVNEKNVSKSYKLSPGDVVDFTDHGTLEHEFSGIIKPQDIPLKILYEDDYYLIISKDAGISVHPSPGRYENTLVNALLFYFKNHYINFPDNADGINDITGEDDGMEDLGSEDSSCQDHLEGSSLSTGSANQSKHGTHGTDSPDGSPSMGSTDSTGGSHSMDKTDSTGGSHSMDKTDSTGGTHGLDSTHKMDDDDSPDIPDGVDNNPDVMDSMDGMDTADCAYKMQSIDLRMRPGIIHRLDKDTSGLIIVAKNRNSQYRMSELFKKRQVEKTYLALVIGRFSEKKGTIALPVGRSRIDRKKMAISIDTGRNAVTDFEIRENYKECTLVNAYPKTGRTHQIRVHFSYIDHPIVGDRTYGNSESAKVGKALGLNRQFLHAQKLSFYHPFTNKRVEIEDEPAEDLVKSLEILRL